MIIVEPPESRSGDRKDSLEEMTDRTIIKKLGARK
jgi:hypothetical protein